MNRRVSSLLPVTVTVAFLVFALLRYSDNNEFLSEYLENAKKNIEHIKNTLSEKTVSFDPAVLPVLEKSDDTSSPDAQAPETPSDAAAYIPETDSPEIIVSPTPKIDFSEAAVNVPLKNADDIKYAVYKDYLVCADKSSLMAFDKDGTSKWALAASFSKPILKTSGNYILLADKGGRLVNVFIGRKLLYSVRTDNIINYASISSKGEAVIVSEKEQYRSCVTVYNKEGDIVFSRNIGSSEVIAADISPSRHLAVTMLNTDSGVSSEIQMWEINSGSGYTGNLEFDDTLIFDIDFSKEILSAASDKGIYGLNQRCKNIWGVSPDSDSDKILLTRSDNSGARVTAFDGNSHPYIKLSDLKGKIRASITLDIIPDFADVRMPFVAYNSGRTVFFGTYRGILSSYTSDKDISDGFIIDKDSIVLIHSNSIEFINTKKLPAQKK
ncbi:MAG: hypothetical protein J1F64_01375 [Oscillospiraceae bacterium]|nr:hypothetical protein [Oscillospiraceae bacterium]